jgi:hypothetical protein
MEEEGEESGQNGYVETPKMPEVEVGFTGYNQ